MKKKMNHPRISPIYAKPISNLRQFAKLADYIVIFAIRLWRLTVSPAQTFLFGANAGCRFTPSCSAYAIEAVRQHGAAAGGWLVVKRIWRCHPWGDCGHDPVPAVNPEHRTLNSELFSHGS